MKKFERFLCTSMIACIVAGLALLFIPLSDVRGDSFEKTMAMVIAIVFWLGIVVEIVMLILADVNRRNLLPANKRRSGKIGIISFLSNREASIVDAILFVFAIVLTVLTVCNVEAGIVNIIIIVIVFLSFNFHCFLNGRNYKYFKNNKGASKYDKNRKN